MIGCINSSSNEAENYIGKYISKDKHSSVQIKKAGKDGYFIKLILNDYSNDTSAALADTTPAFENYSFYCYFEDDCYFTINKKNKVPVFCIENNTLTTNDGKEFKKVK